MALLRLRNVAIRLAVVALASAAVHANAQEFVTDEYQVKAAFLYNFAKFVEWPSGTLGRSSPIAICVLGQNPFGRVLEDTVSGKTVDGKTFVVRRVSDGKSAALCQILFVSSSERMRLESMLGELRAGHVLTVGETDAFIDEGGIINLKLDSGKVQIQINVNAADQGGVRISSKLLSLAQIIRKPVQAK
jgi:YfiR/HmsC-like